jgi:hypothetical protein
MDSAVPLASIYYALGFRVLDAVPLDPLEEVDVHEELTIVCGKKNRERAELYGAQDFPTVFGSLCRDDCQGFDGLALLNQEVDIIAHIVWKIFMVSQVHAVDACGFDLANEGKDQIAGGHGRDFK